MELPTHDTNCERRNGRTSLCDTLHGEGRDDRANGLGDTQSLNAADETTEMGGNFTTLHYQAGRPHVTYAAPEEPERLHTLMAKRTEDMEWLHNHGGQYYAVYSTC